MCDRKLKHYDKYLHSLKLYIKALGFKIEYKEIDSEGAYIPSRRKVKIDPDLSETGEIATILHELGHALDDMVLDCETINKVSDAYMAFDREVHTKIQHKYIMSCERRAWKYGRVIAEKLGIRLGKWYDIEEKEALSSYRKRRP